MHIYVMAYGAYLIMLTVPQTQQHKYVVIWALGYLSCQFLHAMYLAYGLYIMDSTSYTMFVCTKVWTLAWAFRDSAVEPALLTEG
jgi:hypothetical protein